MKKQNCLVDNYIYVDNYNFTDKITKNVITYYRNPMYSTNVQASNKEVVAFYTILIAL